MSANDAPTGSCPGVLLPPLIPSRNPGEFVHFATIAVDRRHTEVTSPLFHIRATDNPGICPACLVPDTMRYIPRDHGPAF